MFYNERLLCRGGRAYAAWANAWPVEQCAGAANHALRSVHDLCVDLKRWIQSRSGDPRRRLAMRTSVTLVAGTANAYRLQVDDLLSDVIQLNAIMEWTRRQSRASFGSHHDQASPRSSKRRSSGPSMDTSLNDRTDRGQMPTPEIMRRRSSAKFCLDISSIRTSSEETGKVEKSFHHRMVDISNPRHSSIFDNNIDSDNISPFGSLNGHLPNDSRIEGELSKGNGDERLEEQEEEESELVSEVIVITTKLSKAPSKSKSASNGCDNSGILRSKRRRYDSECIPGCDEQRVETVDVATQTDDLQERNRTTNSKNVKMDYASHSGPYSKQSFDHLPVGVILVYNRQNNQIPRNLILASLDPKLLSELE